MHPRDIGLDTMSSPIRNAFLPHYLYIPLQQHIGSPAEAVVAPGDVVSRGDVIGKASGYVSVNIHTPLPGKVIAVQDHVTATADRVPTVVIEVEGRFSLKGQVSRQTDAWKSLSRDEIISRMKEHGLVGMGGATFPMHVKYSVPADKKITTLLVNAVECEPFLSADNRLVIEHGEDLVTGIEIALKALGVNRAIIGFEADMPEAVDRMRGLVANRSNIEVLVFPVKYPQGAEKQLVKAATGLEVPSGGLPLDIGVVVSNAGSLVALKEAVVDNKPLFERIVTVTGDAVEKPGNYKIAIGTRVADVLAEVGLKKKPARIIIGGPMMGLAQYSDQVPVTKGTSGILVLSARRAAIYRHRPCVRCGKCMTVCPMGLVPLMLVSRVELGMDDEAKKHGLLDCIECGCCSAVCPSERHLSQAIKLGKLRHVAKKREAAGD